jgi:hypothetical protein
VNPVAALSHLAAIVLGILGGVWAINAVTPELPDSDVEPGVEIPVPVEPEAPESLFQPGPLSTAIVQLEGQEGDGVEYAFLSITPTTLSVSDVTVKGGVEPGDLSAGEPERVIELLGEERSGITPEVVRQMDLVATKEGLVWVVHLDSTAPGLSPPYQYLVPYGTDDVEESTSIPDPLT